VYASRWAGTERHCCVYAMVCAEWWQCRRSCRSASSAPGWQACWTGSGDPRTPRRACLLVSPLSCPANVTFAHPGDRRAGGVTSRTLPAVRRSRIAPGQLVAPPGIAAFSGGADALDGDEVLLANQRRVRGAGRDYPPVGQAPSLYLPVSQPGVGRGRSAPWRWAVGSAPDGRCSEGWPGSPGAMSSDHLSAARCALVPGSAPALTAGGGCRPLGTHRLTLIHLAGPGYGRWLRSGPARSAGRARSVPAAASGRRRLRRRFRPPGCRARPGGGSRGR
jgi:hypothetical protein